MASNVSNSGLYCLIWTCGSNSTRELKFVCLGETFDETCKTVHQSDCEYSIECAKTEGGPWTVVPPKALVGDVMPIFEYKFIKTVCVEKTPATSSGSTSVEKSYLDVLMSKTRILPNLKTTSSGQKLTRKDDLFNSVIGLLKEKGVGFEKSSAQIEGTYVAQLLTNALWTITNQHTVIYDAALHDSHVTPVPDIWSEFQGFNEMKRKKLKEQPMSCRTLKAHSEALWALCSRPSLDVTQNCGFKEDIKRLAECLGNYQGYLKRKNEQALLNQARTAPVRQVDRDVFLEYCEAASCVANEYTLFNDVLAGILPWEPVFFDEDKYLTKPFCDAWQRYSFFQKMRFLFPVSVLKYCPGGSHTTIVYVWKMPDVRADQSEEMTHTARIMSSLKTKMPEFHSRSMKQQWKKKFCELVTISPALLDAIYEDLTLDTSGPRNPLLQQRIKIALLGEPGIITDLRKLNSGRPGDTFNSFWEAMEGVINEVTAAQERRHGVACLSEWLSMEDLINQVKQRCEEGTMIPSKALVRLQFSPKNPYTKRALQFTNRFKIQYKIQVRQLRASHPDAHFCAALFKYLRARAIQLRDHITILFMDDKAKIPVGEPGGAVSTGVRGRQSLVPTDTTLSALDHDVASIGSFATSVMLKVEIPAEVNKSWYRGQVSVCVNDAVFECANPFRNAAVMIHDADPNNPILFKYSDGGVEHRNVLIKVQLSLIAVFKILNLDLLVAARCAPGQSWVNPVERVMAILNIGLQNVATERDKSSHEIEAILKRCGSMAEIRKTAETNPELRDAWAKSVAPVSEMIAKRFERLKLKGEPFKVNTPVSKEQIQEVINKIKNMFPEVDPETITKQQANTRRNENLKTWMEQHCRLRHYCFQVQKCSNPECCPTPRLQSDMLQWLPDPVKDPNSDHYLPLDEVLGTDTSDNDRPGLSLVHKAKSRVQPGMDQQGQAHMYTFMEDAVQEQEKNTSLFTAQCARGVVNCEECSKPRMFYSRLKLSSRQSLQLSLVLSELDYTCGSPLLPESHSLSKTVQARLAISCGDAIEFTFYSSAMGRADTCSYCGSLGASLDHDLCAKYKTVLPCCQTCLANGKKIIIARPYSKK